MQSLTNLAKHALLVDVMADRMGIDLEEAVLRGRINFDEIADAVLRCTGCTRVEECQALVVDNSGTELPEYCRNAELFRELGAES